MRILLRLWIAACLIFPLTGEAALLAIFDSERLPDFDGSTPPGTVTVTFLVRSANSARRAHHARGRLGEL